MTKLTATTITDAQIEALLETLPHDEQYVCRGALGRWCEHDGWQSCPETIYCRERCAEILNARAEVKP